MTDTAFISPGTVTEDTTTGGAGTDLLNNYSNLASTSIDAIVNWSTGTRLSAYYRLSNFDFSSIPSGSNIDGIRARVNHYSEDGSTDNLEFIGIFLVDDTSSYRTSGNKVSGGGGEWPTTDTSTTFGTTSDTWGESAGFWTTDKIKNSNFGFVVQIRTVGGGSGTSPDGQIRDCAISISYSAPASDTISETRTASDTVAGIRQANVSISESRTATDSRTGLAIGRVSVSETRTASDLYSGSKLTTSDLSETINASDGVIGTLTASVTLSESASASDVNAGMLLVDASLSETRTASDSYSDAKIIEDNISESVSGSDSFSAQASQAAFHSESLAATDSEVCTVVSNGKTSDTCTASETFSGGAIGVGDFQESGTLLDAYDSIVIPASANSIVETIIASDDFSAHLAANDNLSESATAFDAYDSSVIPAGGTEELPIGGSGDDSWAKYLRWIKAKKRKQWRKRAKHQHIPQSVAFEIVDLAAKEVERQEVELKSPYFALAHTNEHLAIQAAQRAITDIYEQTWAKALREVGQSNKRELEEEEEFFLMMM